MRSNARRRRSLRLVAAAATVGAALACGGDEPAAPRGVLLLSLDTTRADALGSYGRRDADTPHLDAMAAESLRFEQAVTTAPYTGPSHASMLTGLYPPQHGLRDFLEQSLPESVDTLAEILAARGWATAAFVSSYVLDPRYGLDQGFQSYSSPQGEAASLPQRPATETIGAVESWLRSWDGEQPVFLWVHLYDAHAPYRPPRRFRTPVPGAAPGRLALLRHLYHGEVAFMDEQVGRLETALRQLGLWDGMVVVVAADHGEALGFHGRRIESHSPWLFDETLRVPMWLRAPGRIAPGVARSQVSVVDLLPTVLELLGIDPPAGLAGRSLVGFDDRAAARPAYSETFYERFPARAREGEQLASLRLDGWKLLTRQGPEAREALYDLTADPDELRDVAAAHPERVAELRAALEALRRGWPAEGPSRRLGLEGEDEAAHLERLRALGYVE